VDRTDIEAAAFRRLVAHLQLRADVQNIDLMILAGFCRNCLANWVQEASESLATPLSRDEARELVYGMPFGEWKERYQRDATPEQLAAFEASKQERKAAHGKET